MTRLRFLFALIALIGAFSHPVQATQTFDVIGEQSIHSTINQDFPLIINSDELDSDDWVDDASSKERIMHIMQATGGSTGAAPANTLRLSSVNTTINQCLTAPVAVVGIAFSADNNATMGPIDVAINLITPTDVSEDSVVGSFTIQSIDGLNITETTYTTGMAFRANSLEAANNALASIVYVPGSSSSNSSSTMTRLFIEVQGQVVADSSAYAFSMSPVQFNASSSSALSITPVNANAFVDLASAINQSVPIPALRVSYSSNPAATISVDIQITNGEIAIRNTANLTIPTQVNPQVINFIGGLTAVNAALSSMSFTARCPLSASCASIELAGFTITVRDYVNNSDSSCPNVATFDNSLVVLPGNGTIIQAAVPTPTAVVNSPTSATINWQDVTVTGWEPTPFQGPVTFYRVVIAQNASGPFTGVFDGLAYTTQVTGLRQNTQYWVGVQIFNGAGLSECPGLIVGGRSLCALNLATFTTPGVAPVAVRLAIDSVSSDSITFSAAPTEGDYIDALVASINSDAGSAGQVMIIPVTVAGGRIVQIISGLTPFTRYTIGLAARNNFGTGPVTYLDATTQLSGPQIVGFVASDPANDDAIVNNGDILTLTFDVSTNTPDVSTKAAIDSTFMFSSPPAEAYTGSWTNDRTLVITLTNVGSATPAIGVLSVKVFGNLRNAAGSSDASDSSAMLTGNWGTFGLSALLVAPSPALTINENAQTFLGVRAAFSDAQIADAVSSYVLNVQVLSPLMSGVSVNGSRTFWSAGGTTLSASGPAATISSSLSSLLLTPPRNYWGPISVQYQLSQTISGSSRMVAQLVQIVTVSHQNHYPVIAAPSVVNIALETTATVTGVQVTDVDVPAGSLTDAVSLIVAVSKSGVLSFLGSAQNGVTYAPSFAATASTIQLSGPLALVNLALQQLQVRFEYAEATFGSPAEYFIAMTVNDHGNGGAPMMQTTKIVEFAVNCPSSTANILPSAFVTAKMSDNSNQVILTVDHPVSETVLATPFVACSSIFTSVTSFGTGAQCHWLSNTKFAIDLGLDATVAPMDSLTTVADAFKRCASQTVSSPSASVQIAAATSGMYLAPISISGPAIGSLCEDLTLSAQTFASATHDLTYTWTLPASIASSAFVQGVARNEATLVVPAAAFTDFATLPPKFTFLLAVTNYMGQVEYASMDVVFSSEAKPLVEPLTPTTVYVHSLEELNIIASARIPSCSAAPIAGAADLSVNFAWEMSPADSTFALGAAPSLSIPAGYLKFSVNSQHVYSFTLTASLSSNPNLLTLQTWNVIVKQAPLVAAISGGITRTADSEAGFVLDASESFDADATAATSADQYLFNWACVSSAPSGLTAGACYSTSGALLPLPTTSMVQVPAGALAPNSYEFTLTWTHQPTGRVSTASQRVRVSDVVSASDALHLYIEQQVMNAGDKLAVFAEAFATSSTFEWSIIGSGSASRVISLENSFNSSATSSALVLNQAMENSFFESGATYGITVKSTDDDGDVSMASTSIYVNAAPTCTRSFVVEPASGVAMQTAFEFTIPAESCSDIDASQTDAILYRFFRREGGLHFWLSTASPAATLTNVLLPTGSNVEIGVRVMDQQGGFTDYTTTVSVSAPTLSTPAQYLAVYTAAIKMPLQEQDAATVSARVGSFVATVLGSGLPTSDLMTAKDTSLTDLLAQTAASVDDSITPVLALIVRDIGSTSPAAVRYALQFVESLTNGAASGDQFRSAQAVLDAALGVISSGQGSTGARRRLLASSIDSNNLNILNSGLFSSLNSLSLDASSSLLTVEGDRVTMGGQHYVGAVTRGVVGSRALITGVGRSSLTVPAATTTIAAEGSIIDVAVFQTPASNFAYLALADQVSDVFYVSAFVATRVTSPFAPHTSPSTAVSSLTGVVFSVPFDAAASAGCLNTVDPLSGVLCSLECRRWNGTGFDTTGVTTDFNNLNNATSTAVCMPTQSGAIALFRSLEQDLILSSTGASSSGGSVDQSAAVRASLTFPAPFAISNMRDFKSGFINDMSALVGEPISRFSVEQVTTNTATGFTTVIIDIWVSMDANAPDAQSVYEQLASLSVNNVLSTAYLRYADLSTWMQQCSDMVFRRTCFPEESSTASAFMMPLIISASVAGALLLCCIAVLVARRYWSAPAKDDKTLDDTFVLPSAGGVAKQYIYSAPGAGKQVDTEISRIEESQIADITLVGSAASVDPHSYRGGDDDEISEPVIVESEAEAAELARNPDLIASRMEHIAEEDDNGAELSTNSASASGASRHFYYVDESQREDSQSRSSSASASHSRSTSRSISMQAPSKSTSHFRIAAGGAAASAAEPSYSSRPVSMSGSQRSTGMGAHFRYSDNNDVEQSVSRTPSLPSLGHHSPSQSSVQPTAQQFQTLSHLELGQDNKQEKRAVKVVRPGQL